MIEQFFPFWALRNLKLPEVKPLVCQLKMFYELNKLTVPEEHLLREAWGFKAACGFIKRKGRREELTKDPWLKFTSHYHLITT